ncbi:MAG TPA: hypothetical protein VFT55_08790 [Planctomycetota bacterium]|nr:hypothetical protein [Planctomycetota bacterium]
MRRWPPILSCLVMLGALVATVLRTIRWPNDWAEAHWLLDYRFGFVKRGLVGQVLTWITSPLGIPVSEGLIGGVALAICVAFCLLLLLLACRIAKDASWSPAVVAAMVAFLTSPFLVMTGHVVGYYDHIFLPLGVLSVWLALRGKLWAGAVVQAVALLIHESCAALIYPVFALACLLHATGRVEPAARPPSLLPLLLPLAVAVVMAIVLASPPASFAQSFADYLRTFPFVQGGYDSITPSLLRLSPSEAWALATTKWPGLPSLAERMTQPAAYGLVLPALIALLVSFAQRARLPASLESGAVAVVVLVPQALHLIAWDFERIWTYSILMAFLVIWLYAEARRLEHREQVGVLSASLLAVAANLLMETPLLDHAQDQMPRGVRVCVMLALLGALLLLAGMQTAMPLRERLRIRGRSLADLWLRRQR